ncbi:hypothetical protein ABZ990_29990, partial [Streptomyces sp. NPDC046203]
MVTFAQAQERAEEWINGDVPAYLHREVRVREFGLGFVVWAEDREEAPTSDGDRLRLVVARDSGEATLWPGLPVGEVIRRYEEEYGAVADGAPVEAAPAAARIDLNQTSFLLSPPEWLQEAADKIGLPPVASNASQATADASQETTSPSGSDESAGPGASGASGAPSVPSAPGALSGQDAPSAPASTGASAAPVAPVAGEEPAAPTPPPAAPPASVPASAPSAAVSGATPSGTGASASDGEMPDGYVPTASDGVPVHGPWADANASAGGADGAVPLPATVFAPPLSGADDEDAPPPVVGADAPTALMHGGSALPSTAIAPAVNPASNPASRPSPPPVSPPPAPIPSPARPPQTPPGPPVPQTPPGPPVPSAAPGGSARDALYSRLRLDMASSPETSASVPSALWSSS